MSLEAWLKRWLSRSWLVEVKKKQMKLIAKETNETHSLVEALYKIPPVHNCFYIESALEFWT